MKHTSAAVEFFATIVLLILIISCLFEKNKSKQSNAFLHLAIANEMAMIFEAISLVFYGYQGFDQLITILNLFAYISGFVLTYLFVRYVHSCIEQTKLLKTRALNLAAILCILSVAVLLIGNYFHLFFEVKDGIFRMTPYFIFSLSYDVVGVMIAVYLIIKHRDCLNPRDVIALATFPTTAILAIFLQYTLVRKASLTFTLTMLSCLMIYLMIQFERTRQFYIQKQQMEEMYTQLMLSQIQPHFIFNSLSSIRRLIKKDSDTAVKAVENFSLYLRKNLDSLNSVHPVPFQRELEHTKEYLYLEKLRFGDRLCVSYDIQCTDFFLPVLTLQPLVENAAQHGILERVSGGTILISTKETMDSYMIEICDDGVGFNPEEVLSDGRSHVGIPNVRYRLNNQCKGKLLIESQINVGTMIRIQIPKNIHMK